MFVVALLYVPINLRTETLYLAAVQKNGIALRFVPLDLRNETLCLAAVQTDGAALEYVPNHLKTEPLCLTAVQQCGEALQFIPENLRTEFLCLAAIRQNKKAFRFVPENLKIPLCFIILKQHLEMMDTVIESLPKDKALWVELVVRLKYLPNNPPLDLLPWVKENYPLKLDVFTRR